MAHFSINRNKTFSCCFPNSNWKTNASFDLWWVMKLNKLIYIGAVKSIQNPVGISFIALSLDVVSNAVVITNTLTLFTIPQPTQSCVKPTHHRLFQCYKFLLPSLLSIRSSWFENHLSTCGIQHERLPKILNIQYYKYYRLSILWSFCSSGHNDRHSG